MLILQTEEKNILKKKKKFELLTRHWKSWCVWKVLDTQRPAFWKYFGAERMCKKLGTMGLQEHFDALQCWTFLGDIYQYVWEVIHDFVLWPTSICITLSCTQWDIVGSEWECNGIFCKAAFSWSQFLVISGLGRTRIFTHAELRCCDCSVLGSLRGTVSCWVASGMLSTSLRKRNWSDKPSLKFCQTLVYIDAI